MLLYQLIHIPTTDVLVCQNPSRFCTSKTWIVELIMALATRNNPSSPPERSQRIHTVELRRSQPLSIRLYVCVTLL